MSAPHGVGVGVGWGGGGWGGVWGWVGWGGVGCGGGVGGVGVGGGGGGGGGVLWWCGSIQILCRQIRVDFRALCLKAPNVNDFLVFAEGTEIKFQPEIDVLPLSCLYKLISVCLVYKQSGFGAHARAICRQKGIGTRTVLIAILWKRISVTVCKNRHILTAPEEL